MLIHFVVVTRVDPHVVTSRFEQCTLGLEDNIFPARGTAPVVVVHEKNAHASLGSEADVCHRGDAQHHDDNDATDDQTHDENQQGLKQRREA